jgi:hypothetical protein
MPFWLYGADTTTGTWYPFVWWHKSTNLTSSWFFMFRWLADYYKSDNVPGSGYQIMDTYLATNDIFDKWHLDTIVVNGNSFSYYQDWVLIFTKRISSFATPDNINITIWCWAFIWQNSLLFPKSLWATDLNSWWGYKWYWQIDEVRLYNRALSSSEIQSLYNTMK